MRIETFLYKDLYKGPVKQIRIKGYDKIDDFGIPFYKETSYSSFVIFDKEGQAKEQICYDEKGRMMSSDTLIAIETGQQISLIDYNPKNGKIMETEILEYDYQSNLTKKTSTNFSRKKPSVKVWLVRQQEYSKYGRLIKTTNFDKYNKPYNQVFYTYNQHGNLICEETQTMDEKVLESTNYIYNESQQLVQRIYYRLELDASDFYTDKLNRNKGENHLHFIELLDTDTFVYNEFGNCIEVKFMHEDGNYEVLKKTYLNNQLIETELSNFNKKGKLKNDVGYKRARNVTKYDQFGHDIESVDYLANGKVVNRSVHKLKYDKYGNILEIKEYSGSALIRVIIYEIEYRELIVHDQSMVDKAYMQLTFN